MRQQYYRTKLTNALNDLTGIKRDLTMEKSADELDLEIAKQQRELDSRLAHNDATRIREIRAALDRLADGSFAECIDCSNAISSKRLDAAPWAARCVRCQEEHEMRTADVDYQEAA